MKLTNRFKFIINFVKEIKNEMQTGRSFHCSVALSGGNIVEYGINHYDKVHPYKKYGRYKSVRGNNKDEYYQAGVHSEINLLEKLKGHNIHKLTLLNIRIDNNGKVALAAPCINCRKVLSQYKFKKVFFTVDENTLGKLTEL